MLHSHNVTPHTAFLNEYYGFLDDILSACLICYAVCLLHTTKYTTHFFFPLLFSVFQQYSIALLSELTSLADEDLGQFQVSVGERESVCVREGESVCVKERESVCVRERRPLCFSFLNIPTSNVQKDPSFVSFSFLSSYSPHLPFPSLSSPFFPFLSLPF